MEKGYQYDSYYENKQFFYRKKTTLESNILYWHKNYTHKIDIMLNAMPPSRSL